MIETQGMGVGWMPQAAIYARVSSERQKEEHTVDSQIEALRQHATDHGWDVPVDWVFVDEGYSGATLLRPGLEDLRDAVAEGGMDAVLVYSPDRLSRKYAYQILLMEEFARQGVAVEFVNGPVGSGPESELLVQFQGMIAEYEKAQIIERTRRGKLHRARQGSVNVLSGAPYGYHYHRRTDDSPAGYAVDPEQAEVVRQIYAWYTKDGLSIGRIAARLIEQGVPTRTGKHRWDRSVVWGILRNPAYAGRAAFRKTSVVDGPARLTRRLRLQGRAVPRRKPNRPRPVDEWIHIPVVPLVSEETFALAQERLLENKRYAARRTKTPSLLQGLVVCRECGYAYYITSTTTSRRKIRYYRCLGSDAYRWEHGAVCSNRPVRQDELDELVWGQVTALLAQPELIRQELDRRLEALRHSAPTARRREAIAQELVRARHGRDRLVEAYQAGLLELADLRERIPALRQREVTLQAQLDALEAEILDAERYLKLTETVEAFIIRLRSSAQAIAIADRQQVLRLLVKQVLVGKNTVTIQHAIPVPSGAAPGGYPLRRGSQ